MMANRLQELNFQALTEAQCYPRPDPAGLKLKPHRGVERASEARVRAHG